MAGKKGIDGEKFLINKDGQLVPDGRKTRGVSNRAKHLRRMVIKQVGCDEGCPYAARAVGGNGLCTEYKAGHVCTVRNDMKKMSDLLDTRDFDDMKRSLAELNVDMIEEAKFHMAMLKAGNRPPSKDSIAAYKAALDGMRLMAEMNRKTVTRELTEVQSLSGNELTQLSRSLKETNDDTSN